MLDWLKRLMNRPDEPPFPSLTIIPNKNGSDCFTPANGAPKEESKEAKRFRESQASVDRMRQAMMDNITRKSGVTGAPRRQVDDDDWELSLPRVSPRCSVDDDDDDDGDCGDDD